MGSRGCENRSPDEDKSDEKRAWGMQECENWVGEEYEDRVMNKDLLRERPESNVHLRSKRYLHGVTL